MFLGQFIVRLSPVHLSACEDDVRNFLSGLSDHKVIPSIVFLKLCLVIGCGMFIFFFLGVSIVNIYFMNASGGAVARDVYVELVQSTDLSKALTFDKHFLTIKQGGQSIVNGA